MYRVVDIQRVLEKVAPPQYQESYDNSGLLIGDADMNVKGVLISLDLTEAVLEEAIQKGCNMVVSHHPLIFKGLKSINSSHWIGRCVQKAVKNDIAVYAIHTNLDNVLTQGVNGKIADRIGLVNREVLLPKKGNLSFSVKAPALLKREVVEAVKSIHPQSLYVHEGFVNPMTDGKGDYFDCSGVVLPHAKKELQRVLADFSVEPVFQLNEYLDSGLGAGLTGELELPVPEREFLDFLKKRLNTPLIRHTQLLGKSVSRVAVCGGAGSFLLNRARAAGADVFITGDFKYHDFFEADNRILVADVGHFESEQYTIELIFDILKDNFSTFALHCTKVNTNPINYY